ncbi:unnamed protein product [Zymoseptoria tritici ST99CH_3D1]|nr:unnamed protein product [Zymoseptoria tritici ST99CH_3D1]
MGMSISVERSRRFLRYNKPIPVPPAELPEEVLAAFHQMSTDSPTHLEFHPQREADQRSPSIKQEGHIEQEEPTEQEEIIAQEANIKQDSERYDDNLSYTTLVYQSSAPPQHGPSGISPPWPTWIAHETLGPTKLPNGRIRLLRASDIHTMRRAGQGINEYTESPWCSSMEGLMARRQSRRAARRCMHTVSRNVRMIIVCVELMDMFLHTRGASFFDCEGGPSQDEE